MQKSAIFFLHGYGASSDSMRSFVAAHLDSLISSEFERVFLDGFVEAPNGRAWFDISWYCPGIDLKSFPPDISIRAYKDAYEAIAKGTKMISQKAEEISVPLDRVCLFGFSQGAIMSFELGARIPFGGIVAYAGSFLTDGPQKTFATKNVMIAHGDKDEVMPIASLDVAREKIEKGGVTPLIYKDKGSGHVVSERLLQPIADFINRILR